MIQCSKACISRREPDFSLRFGKSYPVSHRFDNIVVLGLRQRGESCEYLSLTSDGMQRTTVREDSVQCPAPCPSPSRSQSSQTSFQPSQESWPQRTSEMPSLRCSLSETGFHLMHQRPRYVSMKKKDRKRVGV